MIICHCNRIRDSELRDAIKADCARVSRLYARLGKRPQCKQCLPHALRLLGEVRAERQSATAC